MLHMSRATNSLEKVKEGRQNKKGKKEIEEVDNGVVISYKRPRATTRPPCFDIIRLALFIASIAPRLLHRFPDF